MRKRTKARELALKLLYQIEVSKEDLLSAQKCFWTRHKTERLIKQFSLQICQGTLENLTQIDSLISKYAQNWQLRRMAVIDRNILRLGCFELLFLPDIPPKVSINEAIELAKKYGDVKSTRFVNGILDKINKQEVSKC